MTTQLHNLTFVPTAALEDNLRSALQGMGQNLGHQKLQELAARTQGYTSRNHRTDPGYVLDEATFFINTIYNDSGVDLTDLDISYVSITFSRQDLDRLLKAEAAVKLIDEWGSMALSCGFDAFDSLGTDDCEEDLTPDQIFVALKEKQATDVIRTEGEQVHITPAQDSEIWISGRERYGYAFSSPCLKLAKLVEAFKTGKLESSAEWILLPPEKAE